MSAPRLRIVFDPTGDLLEATRDCEADIFLQWYGNTREQLAEEYGPYEHDSVFVSVVDDTDEVLACVRLLTGATTSLKTVDDVSRPPWAVDAPRSAAAVGVDVTRAWDVATMGVRPGLKQGRTGLALATYHALITSIRANSVPSVVAILDERVRRLLTSVGWAMRTLPGTRAANYLGSDSSTPVYADIAQILDEQRRVNPDAHRLITLGVGLDGVQVPGNEHFRLVRVPAEPLPALVSVGAGSLR